MVTRRCWLALVGWMLSWSLLSAGLVLATPPDQNGAKTKPSSADTVLFVEVRTTPEKLYVQAQLIYTLQFFRSVEILGASLTDLQASAADAVIEVLGEDRNFETKRHGQRYLVVERRYAIFPQYSGRLTLLPVRLEARLARSEAVAYLATSAVVSPAGEIVVQRHSPEISLEVEPIPPAFRDLPWLPARQLQVEEQWSERPPSFRVGEAISRTLAVFANGLTAAQLPEILDVAAAGSAKETASKQPVIVKRYPDQPVLTDQRNQDGIIGMRQERVTLVPFQTGTVILPAVSIPWWNIDTQTREMAYLPERSIVVLPSSQMAATSQEPATAGEERATAAQADAAPTNAGCTDLACHASKWLAWLHGVVTATEVPLLTLFLGFGWVVTAFGCWWRGRLRPILPPTERFKHENKRWWWPFAWMGSRLTALQDQDSISSPDQPVRLLKLLKRACLQNSPAKCRSILLMWAQANWPEQALRNLNDVQSFLTAQHDAACVGYFAATPHPAGQHQPDNMLTQHIEMATLAQEIARLNQTLFSPIPRPWQGQGLWASVVAIHAAPVRKS